MKHVLSSFLLLLLMTVHPDLSASKASVLNSTSKGPPSPSVVLTKTVGTDPQVCANGQSLQVEVGQNVYYCFEIENLTNETLDMHEIVDSDVGTILTNFAFGLAPAASAFVTAEQTIYADVISTATWTAEDLDTTMTYTSVDSTTVTVAPPVVLTKTVGTDPQVCSTTDEITVASGSNVYHCFRITNNSQATFDLHTLEDSEVGTILDNFVFALAPAASVWVTAEQTIFSETIGTATWTAFEENTGIPYSSTDSATVHVPKPTPTPLMVADLTVDKTHSPGTVLVGEDVTYTIEVTNLGPDTATGVVLEDRIPSSFFFLSSSPDCTFSGGVLTCPLDEIPNSEVRSVTVTVRVLSSFNLCNIARVGAIEIDPNPLNNSAQSCAIAFTPTFHPADINEDTEIDANDLLELLKAWQVELE